MCGLRKRIGPGLMPALGLALMPALAQGAAHGTVVEGTRLTLYPGQGEGAPALVQQTRRFRLQAGTQTLWLDGLARRLDADSLLLRFPAGSGVHLLGMTVPPAAEGLQALLAQALGKPVQASVTASSGPPQIGGPDYAVLAVPPQMNIQPLALTTSVTQLEPVVAAGFPGAEEEMDRSFELLLNGAASTVPPVILTDGRISAIQTSDVGYKILPHTAQISKGNSGGPLVDQCGRVVGIDTFESVQQDEAVHLNYALEASDAAAFLKSKHINATVVNGACTGAAAARAQRAHTASPT